MPYDVLIIGGGHNGLVAAAYLARAGLSTLVVERRPLLGGACVTEELWPGFRISRAAYVLGLLRPVVARELELRRHGLRLIPRDPASFTPLPEGGGLLLGPDAEASERAIERLSPRDARAYRGFMVWVDRVARAFEPLLDAPPPSLDRPRPRDLAPGWGVLRRLAALGGHRDETLALLLGSAGAVLRSHFESEALRVTLATDALIGAWAAPSTPGTGYVLLHHAMAEIGAGRGVWAYVAGGMGGLTRVLEASARAAGCEIRTACAVESVVVERGRARGARLADGRTIEARCVVSNADPHRTLLGLVGREHLPARTVREVEALDFRSPVAKINLALDRLPRFRGFGGSGPGPQHRGTAHLGARSLEELERSFAEAALGRIPERPLVELTLPSVLDATLAPPGSHVASLFVQPVPPRASASRERALRDALADRAMALVEEVAPGFVSSVIERETLMPWDLERLFGLTGGHIFHGAMTPDRLLAARPVPGWRPYRTPIEGLYLCGAGTHPGGGVMGACGRNAAREVLRDLRARRQRRT